MDKAVFPILEANSSELAERLKSLTGRVAALEELESEAASEKTIATFGAPLTASEVVERIISEVKQDGDAALLKYSHLLDGVEMTKGDIRVSEEELNDALSDAPRDFVKAARRAAGNIRRYQKRLLPAKTALRGSNGVRVGAKWRPVDVAACYVPGGIASYPSSVLMNAVPAQVAGVPRIVLAMPPGREGAGNPLTLATAALLDCKEVYRVGGAQAIGALAYGTDVVPKVDVIVGPGNLFVMLAKREVFGMVNIDMFAGPSEILVIADDTAKPEFVAADLLSQAEHDQMASSILVTDSPALAKEVREEMLAQLENHPRKNVALQSLTNYGVALIVKDMDEATKVAAAIAPEHLEIIAKGARKLANKIKHAGAIFIGAYTPESLGDYAAGPSHTLPTGGTARFMSGLSPLSFMKRTSLIEATRDGLKRELATIDQLARADGLPSHADSPQRRFGKTALGND